MLLVVSARQEPPRAWSGSPRAPQIKDLFDQTLQTAHAQEITLMVTHLEIPAHRTTPGVGATATCLDCADHAAQRARRRQRLRTCGQGVAGAFAVLAIGGTLVMLLLGLPLYAGPLAALAAVGISAAVAMRGPERQA